MRYGSSGRTASRCVAHTHARDTTTRISPIESQKCDGGRIGAQVFFSRRFSAEMDVRVISLRGGDGLLKRLRPLVPPSSSPSDVEKTSTIGRSVLRSAATAFCTGSPSTRRPSIATRRAPSFSRGCKARTVALKPLMCRLFCTTSNVSPNFCSVKAISNSFSPKTIGSLKLSGRLTPLSSVESAPSSASGM